MPESQTAAYGPEYRVTRESWEVVMKEIKKKFPGARILNWFGSCAHKNEIPQSRLK